MPELPEVETIRRVLEPQLQNRTIEKVTVNHKDAVAYPSVDDFCLGLTGQMVSHIQRRGKFLIICMKSGDRDPASSYDRRPSVHTKKLPGRKVHTPDLSL